MLFYVVVFASSWGIYNGEGSIIETMENYYGEFIVLCLIRFFLEFLIICIENGSIYNGSGFFLLISN